MDILFNLIINLGFWLVIIILVLATISGNSKKKTKEKQEKQPNPNKRTIGRMNNTNQKHMVSGSTATKKRNAQQQSTTTQYSGSEHSENRKDYLDRLREKYQETTSGRKEKKQETAQSNAERREKHSDTDNNPTEYQKSRIAYLEQREKENEKRNKRREKRLNRKSKRRRGDIKEYYDSNPIKLEKVQPSNETVTEEENELSLPTLNQNNLRQAVIMKEILDKPKSLRK